MKKILLSAGVIATAAVPMITMVSCGGNSSEGSHTEVNTYVLEGSEFEGLTITTTNGVISGIKVDTSVLNTPDKVEEAISGLIIIIAGGNLDELRNVFGDDFKLGDVTSVDEFMMFGEDIPYGLMTLTGENANDADFAELSDNIERDRELVQNAESTRQVGSRDSGLKSAIYNEVDKEAIITFKTDSVRTLFNRFMPDNLKKYFDIVVYVDDSDSQKESWFDIDWDLIERDAEDIVTRGNISKLWKAANDATAYAKNIITNTTNELAAFFKEHKEAEKISFKLYVDGQPYNFVDKLLAVDEGIFWWLSEGNEQFTPEDSYKITIDMSNKYIQYLAYSILATFDIPVVIGGQKYLADYSEVNDSFGFRIAEESNIPDFENPLTGENIHPGAKYLELVAEDPSQIPLDIQYNSRETYSIDFYNATTIGDYITEFDKNVSKIKSYTRTLKTNVFNQIIETPSSDIFNEYYVNNEDIDDATREQIKDAINPSARDIDNVKNYLKQQVDYIVNFIDNMDGAKLLALIGTISGHFASFTSSFIDAFNEESNEALASFDYSKWEGVNGFDVIDFNNLIIPNSFRIPSTTTHLYAHFKNTQLPSNFAIPSTVISVETNSFENVRFAPGYHPDQHTFDMLDRGGADMTGIPHP